MPSSAPSTPPIGCCANLHQVATVARAGFDFIELPVVHTLMPDADGDAFAPTLAELEASPLPVESFNLFLPGDLRLVGPDVDHERIHRYVHHAMDRAAAVGGKVIVFGSAGARRVPDGYDPDDAFGQVEQFLAEAAPVAERFGVTLAIEPLNRGESNLLNSVPEAADLAQAVHHPHVRVLADLYHMAVEHEPLDHVVAAGNLIAHVHVADTGRFAPGTGDYDTLGLFRRLKARGYAGRVAIECTWRDFDAEAPTAVAFLRETWACA